MEIEIGRQKRDGEFEKEYKNLTIINKLQGDSNLFLISEEKVHLDDSGRDRADQIRIYKVIFLASCKIEGFSEEKLVAFYNDSEYGLMPYLLSDLKGSYFQPQVMKLIDYKAYCEACELTGETKLPFYEYYRSLNESMSLNTILTWKDSVYNADAQAEFFNKYDMEQKLIKTQ